MNDITPTTSGSTGAALPLSMATGSSWSGRGCEGRSSRAAGRQGAAAGARAAPGRKPLLVDALGAHADRLRPGHLVGADQLDDDAAVGAFYRCLRPFGRWRRGCSAR
ncbi:hypothetical protein OG339_48845 (plasmid) [Streptosporangium sp. NBC_01495]|uniref:hypothetical protein n=1 Tax=Streptosporangium sp. NBC_01495 TaxID=2903899 RepID=UPI002E30068E|nr:hypothetical protein [Streptosporangium sp. NBC_01495]